MKYLNANISKSSFRSAHRLLICLFFLPIIVFMLGFSQLAIAENKLEYNIAKSWFKPSLSVNNDSAVCTPLLNGYLNSFRSDLENPLPADFDGEKTETTSTKIISEKLHEVPWDDFEIGDNTLQIAEFRLSGKYYAAVRRNYSIGWREGYHDEILISKPFANYGLDANNYIEYFESNNFGIFSKAENSNIYKPVYKSGKEWKSYKTNIYAELANVYEKDGAVYLLFKVQDDYLLLKLLDQTKFTLTCQLSSTPPLAEINEQTSKLASVSALKTTLHEMMGTECNGGTLHALTGAENSLNNAFNVMTYRPWVLGATEGNKGSYDETTRAGIEKNLNQWGYSGIWQYSKYINYLIHIQKAEDELSRLYQQNFSLSAKDAGQLARTAISNALIVGFNHGRINDELHDIHKKILEGTASAKDIDGLKLATDAKEATSDYAEDAEESPLTLAIAQSPILKLLLNKGANPNEQNWFGKTPLMYAAQFNQLESAKSLLGHGAHTEVYTLKNSNSCIKTNHLSALHYAVKYASKDFISLLLKQGAPTSAKDSNGNTPLDYLKGNKNPNLTPAELKELITDLAKPDENQSRLLSQNANLNAEKLYREKKIQDAYISLKNALILDASNEQALSNLALIALKLNKLGESAEASSKIIATTKSDEQKANAYFNLGLACRKAGTKGYHYATIDYDGLIYCADGRYTYGKKRTDNGVLSSFMSSYQLKPNKDRLSTLLSVLQDEDRGNKKAICYFPENGSGVHSVYFNESYWYFLVDTNKSVPFSQISGFFSNGEQTHTVKSKETVPLTNKLKIERWYMEQGFQVPTRLDNLICAPSIGKAYSTNAKIVAVFPSSTEENTTPRAPSEQGKPYKKLAVQLANTMPVILYFYAHNTEFNITGDASNIAAIYVYGNALVTLPTNANIQIIRDGKPTYLSTKVDHPGINANYLTGLPLYSSIDMKQDVNITLTDKVITENRR